MDPALRQKADDTPVVMRWQRVLQSALATRKMTELAHDYVVRLATHMVHPPADPATATVEIRDTGATAAFFVNGHRINHQDLLRKRFEVIRDMPHNTFQWLRKRRFLVDEQLARGCSEAAFQKVLEAHARIEEIYADKTNPNKTLYEAFNLGRVTQILEDDQHATTTNG